jgi:Matrixin
MQKLSITSVKTTQWLQAGMIATGVAILSASPVRAFSFTFDYSYDTNGFFAQQDRRDALTAAAGFFEARITDELTAIAPSGTNSWNATFSNPGDGSNTSVSNLSVSANTILVYAGGYDLSGNTLGLGGPGGYGASGQLSFFNTLKRGQTGASAPNPTDVGIWGGAITFDTLTNWNFSVSNGPGSNQSDFLSVALHELGHLLGLGTSASWNNTVTSGNPPTFTGTTSVGAFGSSIPLESDYGHWKEGTQSKLPGTNIAQEAAMDPTITVGTRKLLTELDFAALDDIGWDVKPAGSSPTPVPAPSLLFGAIGFGLRLLAKRKAPAI